MENNLKLYNTQSRKKELFTPLEEGKVGMYVCGPTVYDLCHIGHGRAYTFFDVVYRHLKKLGYQVNYVRNLTDIDDKIIKRAQQAGKDHSEISQTFTVAFHDDMRALGNLPPQVEPRATENIAGMLRMIETLISAGHAYAVGSDVYFDVDSYRGYLQLSGRTKDELLAGARVEVNEQKRNPLDFALWKGVKPGEPSWPSPWGAGRPGWHIECSVMSQRHLGVTIDLHGGGRDLIFPHHENERAQSEAVSGRTFARYWLHNGFVNLDKEKMSKSLGNLVTIRDLLRDFHPEVLRHALLSSHYRSPIEFSTDLLHDSHAALARIYLFLNSCKAAQKTGARPKMLDLKVTAAYMAAMNDDFNTPKALAALFDAVTEGNRRLNDGDPEGAANLAATIVDLGEHLGLLQADPASFLKGGADTEVDALVAKRLAARQGRDFALADQIRQELLAKGIILEDRPDGSCGWRRKG